MPRARLALISAVLSACTLADAHAQSQLGVRTLRRDTLRAAATVTAAFMVTNARPDTVTVRTRLELPAEWTALTGSDSVIVAPGSSEMVMLSVMVPGRALAGTYTIRMWATSAADPRGVHDTLLVRVPERRATDVTLQDRPGYVISGRGYETAFQVRNRGNLVSRLRLSARGSVGAVALSDSVIRLQPNEARLVRARVRTPEGMNAAVDDVVEMVVEYDSVASATEPVRASSRVTVVPEPSRTIENFLRIPARLNVRAATSAGVSPMELFGQGLVRDGGAARLDFMFRGPTGAGSVFGERDEYRVELRAPAWRVRGGDHFFMLSSLTAPGQPGFGVGADGDLGIFSAGAYSQTFRRVPEKGTDHGAFVGVRPLAGANLGLNAVTRSGGAAPGGIASATARLEREHLSTELEMARSSVAGAAGLARHARVSAAAAGLTIDMGHLYADTGFAGMQRGAERSYVTAHSAPLGFVSFGLNGSMHRSDLSRSTGVPYEDRFRTAAVLTTLFERVTIEAGTIARTTVVQGTRADGRQAGLRSRADHDFDLANLSLELEGGRAAEAGAERRFSAVGLGARRGFLWGSGSVYGQRYSGGSLTRGAAASVTLGGDATLRVWRATHATMIAYATRQETALAEWHTQLDAMVSRGVRTGGTVTLRARLLAGGSRTVGERSVMYLEYGMPMRLPVSPLRTTGRVTGRVVDAASGRGVAGALVRLGPQVAITDANGGVSFGGVPGGQHRLSMSQETSFANAVFVGDPTLEVDSTRVHPTTFSLTIARSARVNVDVRRFTAVRTAIDAGADALREAGGVSNVTLILAGDRDTMYRTSDGDGQAVFTDIPPGQWTLTVRGDTPAFTRFDPDRLELELEPGESRALEFRLVPRRREVQMIGDGQELRPTTADPRAPVHGAAGTRTVKPEEKRPD